ncbi:HRAS-like suppressor 3 isoform X1 [Alligator sinensis]|uniref:HRAS-like suppressor 3 isoform X1 n=1 Tax=Alligator sinensis TaxID=38654 RepID=A0A1U7SK03_ALLSI|nr:HRAS-like suppressor 3 isoform X1 [Alligator sinensis]
MPDPGDLIQIFGPLFEHWALYVGDGYVVHLSPLEDSGWLSSSRLTSGSAGWAVVKKQRLCDVVRGDRYRVNNKDDRRRSPRPVGEILAEAEAEVGKKLWYSLLFQNCEHFVTKLRYGRRVSHQVRDAVTSVALTLLIFVSPYLFLAAAAARVSYVLQRES